MGEKGADRGDTRLEEQRDSVALRLGGRLVCLLQAGLHGAWRWFWKAGDASL